MFKKLYKIEKSILITFHNKHTPQYNLHEFFISCMRFLAFASQTLFVFRCCQCSYEGGESEIKVTLRERLQKFALKG